MALFKMKGSDLTNAIGDPIIHMVATAFEKKLEDSMNGIVEKVFAEIKEEMPDKITARINSAFDHLHARENMNINVEIDFRERK